MTIDDLVDPDRRIAARQDNRLHVRREVTDESIGEAYLALYISDHLGNIGFFPVAKVCAVFLQEGDILWHQLKGGRDLFERLFLCRTEGGASIHCKEACHIAITEERK